MKPINGTTQYLHELVDMKWNELHRLSSKRPGHRTREGARQRVTESLEALDREILEVRGRLRYLIATENGPLSVSRMTALGALLYTREKIEKVLLDDIERDTLPGEAHPWGDEKCEAIRADIAELEAELTRRHEREQRAIGKAA